MDGTGQFEPNGPHSQSVLPLHVRRALAYMNNNLAEKIALRELARACAAPERTLLKQFQRFLGVSPLAYLRRLRLNMARRELLETGSTMRSPKSRFAAATRISGGLPGTIGGSSASLHPPPGGVRANGWPTAHPVCVHWSRSLDAKSRRC